MNVIEELEKEQVVRLAEGKKIPQFAPGDTIRVNVKVVEGTRERVQVFEGVCIGRKGGGLNESFTVRKISFGEGVERVFPLYSPNIAGIEVVRRGDVRRAKLYYLRGRTGKRARIAEAADGYSAKLTAEERNEARAAKAEADARARAKAAEKAEAKAAEKEAKAKPKAEAAPTPDEAPAEAPAEEAVPEGEGEGASEAEGGKE